MAGLMLSPTLPCTRCAFAGRPLSLQTRQMAAPAQSRTPLTVEAKRSKAADFRGLSQEQIKEQVQAAKRELFDLRVKQRTKQVRSHLLLHISRHCAVLRVQRQKRCSC